MRQKRDGYVKGLLLFSCIQGEMGQKIKSGKKVGFFVYLGRMCQTIPTLKIQLG